MFRHLFSVAAFTLLSRATGFFRDVMLGAALGAGLAADAFYVAFRLPNHFRAIFGEGAFNAAYVPAYARALETRGPEAARAFSAQVFALLLASQIVLLALAWSFTPQLVALLAPGFSDEPEKFALAVALTRITFPYLLFVTLATLVSGTLNANRLFAAAAFSPTLLNVVMIAALATAFLFPDAAHAAAWGVALSGVAQFAQVLYAARRADLLGMAARPNWGADFRRFFGALGPAVLGSAGVQIAIFADTIIASLLPTGSVSAIYYADRIYQLPIGVIGVAAGTVLLPEMSRRLSAGDAGGAAHAQNRTMALTIALAAPFVVAFLILPVEIMRGVFLRGRFTQEAASQSGAVLAAYATGLIAVVLIASARASFQARGDTRTPMFVALVAVVVNVAMKFALYQPLGAAGLALATALGAWINLALLLALAGRAGLLKIDATLGKVCAATLFASLLLAALTWFGRAPAFALARSVGIFENEIGIGALALAGGLVYGVALGGGLWIAGVRLARR